MNARECHYSRGLWRRGYTLTLLFSPKEKIRSAPKIIIIWEQEEPVYAGSNLELSCIVLTKYPDTKYRWYYRDSDVPESKKLGTLLNQSLYESRDITTSQTPDSWPQWQLKLKLKNVSVADSGLYACQAENNIGYETRHTYLNVRIRPITSSATGM